LDRPPHGRPRRSAWQGRKGHLRCQGRSGEGRQGASRPGSATEGVRASHHRPSRQEVEGSRRWDGQAGGLRSQDEGSAYVHSLQRTAELW